MKRADDECEVTPLANCRQQTPPLMIHLFNNNYCNYCLFVLYMF